MLLSLLRANIELPANAYLIKSSLKQSPIAPTNRWC